MDQTLYLYNTPNKSHIPEGELDFRKYGFVWNDGQWWRDTMVIYEGIMMGSDTIPDYDVCTIVEDYGKPSERILLRDKPYIVENYLKQINRDNKLTNVLDG